MKQTEAPPAADGCYEYCVCPGCGADDRFPGAPGIVDVRCRVKIEADLADWTQWALLNDVLPEVVTFFQHRPELFNTFDPSRAEPYCCARTAVFASRLIRSAPAGLEYELLGGVVGDGVATELTAFLRVWRDRGVVQQERDRKAYGIRRSEAAKRAALTRKTRKR